MIATTNTASLRCQMLLVLIAGVTSGCGPTGRDLSDTQWLRVQQDLQDERAEVGHQRDLLEADRRRWSEREHSEPLLAAVISSSVLLICCVLPLFVVGVLLWPKKPEPADDAVGDLVMDEMVAAIESANQQSKRIEVIEAKHRLASGEP